MLRPRTLLLAALAATLLLAPLAQAQGNANVVVKLDPAPADLAPGEVIVIRGTATFVSDAIAYTSTVGVPISYAVAAAPAWAGVLVSPASDIITFDVTPGVTVSVTKTFEVLVAAPASASGTGLGPVTITATTGTTSPLMRAAVGSGSTPVRLVAGPGCVDASTVSAQDAGAVVFTPGVGLAGLAPLGLVALGRRTGSRLALALAAAALVGAAVALPTASAQAASAVTVRLDAPPAALEPGGSMVLRGVVTYYGDAFSQAELTGIPYQLFVKNAPEWAYVTLSPSSGIFFMDGMPGLTTTQTQTFEAIVHAADDAPRGQFALLEVTATVPGHIARPAPSATGATLLATALPACAPAAPSLAIVHETPLPDADAPADDVTLQSAATTARPVAPYVLGCALVGAALGVALARKFRR